MNSTRPFIRASVNVDDKALHQRWTQTFLWEGLYFIALGSVAVLRCACIFLTARLAAPEVADRDLGSSEPCCQEDVCVVNWWHPLKEGIGQSDQVREMDTYPWTNVIGYIRFSRENQHFSRRRWLTPKCIYMLNDIPTNELSMRCSCLNVADSSKPLIDLINGDQVIDMAIWYRYG